MAGIIASASNLGTNMIVSLLFAAAALFGIYRFVKIVQSKPTTEQRAYYITLLVGLGAAGLVLLSVTGRVPWVAGVIGGALPFVRQLILKYVYRRISSGKQQDQSERAQSKASATSMNKAQALSTLGLEAGASKEDIINAHRKLMQKFHPDRGGNDLLASQINDAKDVLLDEQKA